LLHEDVVKLQISQEDTNNKPEEASTVLGLAGGQCFDFDKGV
jgi:hypothetical protein